MHSEVKQETLLFEGNDSDGDGNRFELSDKRVRLSRFKFGSSRIVSIMLEHVTSCEMTKKSYPILLFLSFVCAFLAVIQFYAGPYDDDVLITTIVVSLGFFLTYMLLKKETLIIASTSSQIVIFKTDGFGTSLLDIMDSVEAAKASRLEQVQVMPLGASTNAWDFSKSVNRASEQSE